MTTRLEYEAAAGPHQALATASGQQRFTARLLDRLWAGYRRRVEYVRRYEQVVRDHQAKFVNDHIAFRTFTYQQPQLGLSGLSRLFEALGYRAAGLYHFDDKSLFATHYEHANRDFPKLFISELQTWKLSAAAQQIIGRTVASHRPPLAQKMLVDLARVEELSPNECEALLKGTAEWIEQLPWNPPLKEDVSILNQESQYGAWVLVHGYNVNHFTSLINSHGVDSLGDIEKTVAVLRSAGVPMKAEIEGAAGSILRQTATDAVVIDVAVQEQGRVSSMPWTYAYFELAERGMVEDVGGTRRRFEGFLGPQATQLFEMTRRK
jgi:hypothetical protein